MAKKKAEKTYGVDLTFWAAKSVSLASLVGEDNRLEAAHRQAVKKTVDFLEEHYAGTEVNGEWVQTNNAAVLMQHHEVSEELNPELHAHCLVVSLTQLPDDGWFDLSYRQIWQNQQLLGEHYHRDLALECRKLGYELEPDEIELFQLRDYTQEQLIAFSKGGKKSCNRIPPAMYDWRQCVEAIEAIKNANSRQR